MSETKARKVSSNLWYVKTTHWAEDKDGVARPIETTANMTDKEMEMLRRSRFVKIVDKIEEME